MEFSTPPLPMSHIVPTVGGGGSGTLRRGIIGLVPPPDVTHYTNHSKSTHPALMVRRISNRQQAI